MGNLIGLASLVIAGATLWYLIEYVKATKIIAKQSIEQVEATYRPAIIALPGGSTVNSPTLVNIGNGPALGVSWTIPSTQHSGTISYLRPHDEPYNLEIGGMKPLYEAAGKSRALIECRYRSISGRQYRSVNQYNVDEDNMKTEFES